MAKMTQKIQYMTNGRKDANKRPLQSMVNQLMAARLDIWTEDDIFGIT